MAFLCDLDDDLHNFGTDMNIVLVAVLNTRAGDKVIEVVIS